MQSSNQPSSERKEQQGEKAKEEVGQEQELAPLYEFPADHTLLQNVSSTAGDTPEVSREVSKEQAAGAEMQAGLVYPPPPSFYQNMQMPVEQPPLPPQQPPVLPPPGSISVYPGTVYPGFAYPPGMQVPPPVQPFFPPSAPPPAKTSRKWIWIVVSILSAALLISCGLCSWAFYTIISTTTQSVNGVINVVDDYYQHIQNQEYDAAYNNDLRVAGLTRGAFIQQAQQSDSQNGAVMSYQLESSAPATGSLNGFQSARYNVIMSISRNKSTYRVLLTVDNLNGTWKITDFDKI